MNPDFSRIIALQRKERKISQKQAAADLGISQALLSHYEKGIRECGLDFLVKIADYYNVSCDYLLGRTPEPGGKILSIEEIPDDDGNNEMPSSFGLQLISKRSSYLMLSVYKLFRIIYNACPNNDQKLFRIPKVVANDSANAIISLSESNIKAASSGIALGGNDSVTDAESLYVTTATLSEDFSEYATSLLNLIQISETSISRTRDELQTRRRP